MIGARLKRIIIQGAMNHESGAEIAKLLTTTAGRQAHNQNHADTKDDRTHHAINKRRNPQPRPVIAVHGFSSFRGELVMASLSGRCRFTRPNT
jgi:hypothetical protein